MYDANNKNFVGNYPQQFSKKISILLHEDIRTDNRRNHTKGARWIGKKLKLNLEVFD